MTAADWTRRREQMELAATFIASWWREFAIGALLIASAWAFLSYGKAQRALGAANEIVRVQDSTIKARKPLVAKYDTAIVHDTVKLNHILTRLASIHDTVLARITDTVFVKAYIAATDSTVKACRELASDCSAFRLNATAVMQAQDTKIHALESIKKPRRCGGNWAIGPTATRRGADWIGATIGVGCRF